MDITFFTLPNGIRVVHRSVASEVAYCGFMVNAGTRDEASDEHGMAHFTEHLLFKGCAGFSSQRIINQLERIGGEVNAYTTKEETVLYAAVLNDHYERVVKLMSNMFFRSVFPQNEIDKELDVILDEIESYNDTPSELIFDDFEALLYADNTLGNAILGDEDSLKTFRTEHFERYVKTNFHTDQMVFFSQGNFTPTQIKRIATKYLGDVPQNLRSTVRTTPAGYDPRVVLYNKDTHQAHYMCGNVAYGLHHPQRLGMYLLNNILGGPGMSSLLNMSLRERNGLVYGVESNFTPLTDTGYWSVYFGSDPEKAARCERLLNKELDKLRTTPLSGLRLHRHKQQLCGQMAISNENQESNVLAMGKRFLHFNSQRTWRETFSLIEQITPTQLCAIANEVFDPQRISVLRYE